jgi:hypothetical protein
MSSCGVGVGEILRGPLRQYLSGLVAGAGVENAVVRREVGDVTQAPKQTPRPCWPSDPNFAHPEHDTCHRVFKTGMIIAWQACLSISVNLT